MSLRGEVMNWFDLGINALRGDIGSFGDLVFQVYAGSLSGFGQLAAQAGKAFIPDKNIKRALGQISETKIMTFDNFQRRTRARYARHQLINRTSVLEKVGMEPDQITLDIKLIRELLGTSVESEVEKIREYIKEGTEESLIIGSEVLGEFVISELSEERLFVDCFGRAQVAELNLTFEETGNDLSSDTINDAVGDLPLIWN